MGGSKKILLSCTSQKEEARIYFLALFFLVDTFFLEAGFFFGATFYGERWVEIYVREYLRQKEVNSGFCRTFLVAAAFAFFTGAAFFLGAVYDVAFGDVYQLIGWLVG